MGPNIAIEVGAGKDDDERALGIKPMKPRNGFRAAARVQRDEHVARLTVVALRQPYPMAELPENATPAQGGDLIAVVKTQRPRSDELNFHGVNYAAQVRKPAQTSRRSGV